MIARNIYMMKFNSFSGTLVVGEAVLVPLKPNDILNILQLALEVELAHRQAIRITVLGAHLLCDGLDPSDHNHRELGQNRLERLRQRLQIQKQTILRVQSLHGWPLTLVSLLLLQQAHRILLIQVQGRYV